jgi:hypothetical protein
MAADAGATAAQNTLSRYGGFAGSPSVLWEGDADFNRDLNAMAATGATWLRFDFDWPSAEPQQGRFYWGAIDRVVKGANARGLKIIATLGYTPKWAVPAGANSNKYPPRNPAWFGDFAKAAAKRYAPMGVKHWEIWNEPNQYFWWKPKPNPVAYTQLLKYAYLNIKSVDHSAVVITGGLAPAPDKANGQTISQMTFLKRIYDNGGRSYMDAVGMHPYSYPLAPMVPRDWNPFFSLPKFHNLMAQHGDGAKKIYATEYGAPTGSDPKSVTQAEQAQFVRQAYAQLPKWPWAGPLCWFVVRDLGTNRANRVENMGIMKRNWAPKQAYASFKQTMHTAG